MFSLAKKNIYSIGIDIDDNNLKLVQLGNGNSSMGVVAGYSAVRPADIKVGSGSWQRWAIDVLHKLVSNGHFQRKEIISAMPANNVYIEHMKMPKVRNNEMENTLFSKIKQKLPFEPVQANTFIRYIPTEQDNILVMATERELINRHLAIYEKAGMPIKSISIWPSALVNCYTKFFGRRQSDLNSVVMLVCIDSGFTNVVICRHKHLLFARSIPLGIEQSDDNIKISSLVLELTSFKRQFCSIYRNYQIERMIFFSTRTSDRDVCITIAKQLEMPAQMGDCLAAVEMSNNGKDNKAMKINHEQAINIIDRRDCRLNWSVAFGLSLS